MARVYSATGTAFAAAAEDTWIPRSQQAALTFTLLSDPDHAVHTAYGVWGEKMNYGKVVEGVIRSTFVIDEQGVITLAQYNVKATGHVARLRKALGLDA